MTRGKRPIDRQRDAAFQMSVGSFEDGAILEMITVGDALYLIAERAIHQAMLADQIDPDRKHPETPHTSQRVASAGAESPIVRRSFLQAAALFRTPYLGDTALSEAGLKTSFGFMQELLAAQQSLAELQAALQTAEKELPIKGQAVHLPSLADVSSRTPASSGYEKGNQGMYAATGEHLPTATQGATALRAQFVRCRARTPTLMCTSLWQLWAGSRMPSR